MLSTCVPCDGIPTTPNRRINFSVVVEPRQIHTPGDFVAAAFDIVDAEGLASLTMRSLGDRLGVDATAVYRHFPNKDALVDALLDGVFAEVTDDQLTGDTPGDRIIALATGIRQSFRRHPNLAAQFASSNGVFQNAFRLSKFLVGEIRALGVTGEDLVRMYQTFEGYILGSSVFDTGDYPKTFTIRQARYRHLNEPEFDEVARSAADVERVTEAAYLDALRVLIARCEELARR
jgi:AcrR family transcriptional regulator